VESSFIVRQKFASEKKVGAQNHGKPWTLKSGGLSLGALQKFTPMFLCFLSFPSVIPFTIINFVTVTQLASLMSVLPLWLPLSIYWFA